MHENESADVVESRELIRGQIVAVRALGEDGPDADRRAHEFMIVVLNQLTPRGEVEDEGEGGERAEQHQAVPRRQAEADGRRESAETSVPASGPDIGRRRAHGCSGSRST